MSTAEVTSGGAQVATLAGELKTVAAPEFQQLDLLGWRNNVGITAHTATGVGALNVWRNSLPAEEVPAGKELVVEGVPFAFPEAGNGEPDNLRCEGQTVPFPQGRFDWIYLLAAGERRVEDEIALHFADGSVDFEDIRVSDFWAAAPHFGETLAQETSAMHYPHHVQRGVSGMIWCQRVPVVRRAELCAVRLPANAALHVFAATLCRQVWC